MEAKQKSVIFPALNTHTHPRVHHTRFMSTMTKSIYFLASCVDLQLISQRKKGQPFHRSLHPDLTDVSWYHGTKLTNPGHTMKTSHIARRSGGKQSYLT